MLQKKKKKHKLSTYATSKLKARYETEEALNRLKQVAVTGGNIFEELMETVKVASLGQITNALYEVGGQYRRNM